MPFALSGPSKLLAELDRSSSKFVSAGLCSMQTPGVRHMSLQRSAPRSSSSGEEVGTPGRTISLLRPKLASCPKNFAFGLIKRRAALQAENIALPHQLSVLQRTNFAVQWGAHRANSECVDYLR